MSSRHSGTVRSVALVPSFTEESWKLFPLEITTGDDSSVHRWNFSREEKTFGWNSGRRSFGGASYNFALSVRRGETGAIKRNLSTRDRCTGEIRSEAPGITTNDKGQSQRGVGKGYWNNEGTSVLEGKNLLAVARGKAEE